MRRAAGRLERDGVDRADERVLGSQHDPGAGLELDDLVLERDRPPQEPGAQREARAAPDRLGREHRALGDAGIPLGGPVEVAEVGKGLVTGHVRGDARAVLNHGREFSTKYRWRSFGPVNGPTELTAERMGQAVMPGRFRPGTNWLEATTSLDVGSRNVCSVG